MNLFLFSAETWFAILFVVLVEIVPASVKTSVLGIFLFLMNNLGGNCPGENLTNPPIAAYILVY
jgi:hypothetical protein